MTLYQKLTCVTMSETTPKDHLIILHEFLADNKAYAMSSSIRAQVNCLQTSVKLHLSCTVLFSYVAMKFCKQVNQLATFQI